MTDKRSIGHEPNQSPSNSMLGRLAYVDDINALDISGDSAYIPDVRPSIHFDAQAERLAPTMGFMRRSGGSYVGRNGFINYATYGTPRFDFDPITLQNKGVLVEEASTNTVTYSYDSTQWLASNGEITSNDQTIRAPDGSFNATRFTKVQSVNSQSHVQIPCSITSTTVFTASAYVKPFNTSKIFFQFTSTPNIVDNLYFYINFDTLTWQYVDYNGSDDSGPHRVQIDEFGFGWYRVSITIRNFAEGGLHSGMRVGTYTGTTNHVYNDTNFHNFYIWGAQMEDTQYHSTSYIKTDGSQVTRTADDFRGIFQGFETWGNDYFRNYQKLGHTIFIEFDYQKEIIQNEYTGIFQSRTTSGTASDNRLNLALYRGGYSASGVEGPMYAQHITTGATSVSVNGVGWPGRPEQRQMHRAAMTMTFDASESDSGAIELSLNGVYKGISSSTSIGDPGEFGEILHYSLGDIAGITQLNGHIKRAYFYPKALTRAQMNWLTGEDNE